MGVIFNKSGTADRAWLVLKTLSWVQGVCFGYYLKLEEKYSLREVAFNRVLLQQKC